MEMRRGGHVFVLVSSVSFPRPLFFPWLRLRDRRRRQVGYGFRFNLTAKVGRNSSCGEDPCPVERGGGAGGSFGPDPICVLVKPLDESPQLAFGLSAIVLQDSGDKDDNPDRQVVIEQPRFDLMAVPLCPTSSLSIRFRDHRLQCELRDRSFRSQGSATNCPFVVHLKHIQYVSPRLVGLVDAARNQDSKPCRLLSEPAASSCSASDSSERRSRRTSYWVFDEDGCSLPKCEGLVARVRAIPRAAGLGGGFGATGVGVIECRRGVPSSSDKIRFSSSRRSGLSSTANASWAFAVATVCE